MINSFFSNFPCGVQAYIDPGTGSIIIQVLIGVIVSGMLVGKIFWNRIKAFVMSLFTKRNKYDKED